MRCRVRSVAVPGLCAHPRCCSKVFRRKLRSGWHNLPQQDYRDKEATRLSFSFLSFNRTTARCQGRTSVSALLPKVTTLLPIARCSSSALAGYKREKTAQHAKESRRTGAVPPFGRKPDRCRAFNARKARAPLSSALEKTASLLAAAGNGAVATCIRFPHAHPQINHGCLARLGIAQWYPRSLLINRLGISTPDEKKSLPACREMGFSRA